MWVGGFLIIGAAAISFRILYASIFRIADNNSLGILNHRDVILGHLLWVSIALGLHSFSLYIHNDTLQAFGEDIFDDNSIQFKPLYGNLKRRLFFSRFSSCIPLSYLLIEML